MINGEESSFGDSARRRMVEEFVVACYNGSLKPNVAEKNPSTGREIEYLMDAPQFDRMRKSEVWSSSSAVGTGYQYRVVYKDRRFSEIDRLMEVYSGTIQSTMEDRAQTEQALCQLILLMMKEGRLPQSFKVPKTEDFQEQKALALVEALSRSLEELGTRVRVIEERLASQQARQVQSPSSQAPESTPSI